MQDSYEAVFASTSSSTNVNITTIAKQAAEAVVFDINPIFNSTLTVQTKEPSVTVSRINRSNSLAPYPLELCMLIAVATFAFVNF